jgi:UDP-N-acetylglucosamine transferase subunit ALG13
MIFVTVGAQMSFDRLVRTVDEWAGRTERGDVFAQIGPSDFEPRHVQWSHFINPTQFQDCMEMADAIIAHAGMGTIITAIEHHKPILVMPRRGDLGETRNDHQIATAREFEHRGVVHVAMDERALVACLDRIDEWRVDGLNLLPPANTSCPQLIDALKEFLAGEPDLDVVQPATPIPAQGRRTLAANHT